MEIEMSTLPPPGIKEAAENTLEKKVYNMVERFDNYITLPNDRYRLAYNLIKFIRGEGDPPEILVNSTKIELVGITKSELAASLNEEIGKIES
jgi:hypothetical protein